MRRYWLVLVMLIAGTGALALGRPLVGAIRWDAWSKWAHYEEFLQPRQWHYRLPFFAEQRADGWWVLREDRQRVVDAEILQAAAGGLDYWAFDWYNPFGVKDEPRKYYQYYMDYCLHLYLNSKYKSKLGFCLILLGTADHLDPEGQRKKTLDYLVSLFTEPTYQRVCGGRPLVYFFSPEDFVKSHGEAGARAFFEELRKRSEEAGTGNPYLVMMTFYPPNGAKLQRALGFDALGCYANPGGNEAKGRPYSYLCSLNQWWWKEALKTGSEFVPTVNTGWDFRPLIGPKQPDRDPKADWFEQGTPEEISAQVKRALEYVEAHPKQCRAQTVLIYAWNELAEGGLAGADAGRRRGKARGPGQVAGAQSLEQVKRSKAMGRNVDVGVYYFPNYHVDKRNEAQHGPGWSEWELVKRAEPRFEGHRQPKVPLWGYTDEADPRVMEEKIAAAADHGVDYFIYDWYWYDDGPFLERGLDEGFLQARNRERLKFCLMWANHDWKDIHPAKLNNTPPTLYPGKVTPETFEQVCKVVIERYFKQPNYYRVEGEAYFSIYELGKLVQSFGSIAATREALAGFKQEAKAAGAGGVHLNAVVWGRPILPGEESAPDPFKLAEELGFDSFTSYVWIHHVALEDFPETDYEYVQAQYLEYWEQAVARCSLPYYPNVTRGWDASPRTVQSDVYQPVGYPFMSTIGGNTPERFAGALEAVLERVEASASDHKTLNLNAWNEWTEGSYLEPDTETGMAYLEAIRTVCGVR